MSSLVFFPKYDFLPRYGRLAVANIVSNLTIPLASLISIGFLGHLSELSYLAGVLLISVVLNLLYNILAFLRMSTTGVTAQAYGRNDRESIILTGLRNAVIALVIGGIILLLQYPIRELCFVVLNATPDVKASGISYFNMRIWEIPAVLLNYVLIGWFLGQAQSGKVLAMSILANVVIVVCDYLLVFRYGWGSAGAGISQALSQYMMLGLGLTFVILQGVWKEVGPLLRQLLKIRAYKSTFSLSTDIFLKTLLVTGTFVIFNSQSSALGTDIFAENSLIFQVVLLCGYFTQGLSYATETLTGIFKGEGAIEKLKYLLSVSVILGLIVAFIFSIICVFFPEPIFGLLTDHEDIVAYISEYVPWLMLFLIFTSMAYILDGYFLGLTQGYTLKNVAIIGIIIGFAPTDFLAWRANSNHLLWLSLSLFMAVRVVTMGIQLPRTFIDAVEQ